jgi:hypothetical protein
MGRNSTHIDSASRQPRGNSGIVVRRYEHAKLANCWQPLHEVMAVRPFEAYARLSHDLFLSISIRVKPATHCLDTIQGARIANLNLGKGYLGKAKSR